MMIHRLFEIFEKNKYKQAICWQGDSCTYIELQNLVEYQKKWLTKQLVKQGDVVSLEADYSPLSIATFIALIALKTIIAPRTNVPLEKLKESREIAQVNHVISFQGDICTLTHEDQKSSHPLFLKLKREEKPGLVIFSSGSTGKSKATVHNLDKLLEKFLSPRHCLRVLVFLLFDHIGGFNTLFYTLFNGGCLIIPKTRSPQDVLSAISQFRAEALTTSPTFLNLLLLNGGVERFTLNSLKYVNYSSEVMPEYLLAKLKETFPKARFSQAYGLSEVGVLPVKSLSSESTYFKMGDSIQTRIVDGMLEIKTDTAMLGYLNADSPFTEDNWFKTGDLVEVNGDYFRILGRKSELINVGGLKVYPAEIENILQQMPNVEEVSVTSEPHPIVGSLIKATVVLKNAETPLEFKKRMSLFCSDRLPRYKIPQKVLISKEKLHNERFKKSHKIGDVYGSESSIH
jgi:long-chain acyl-CoA synthetase